jgi:hypothetical protein
MTGELVAAVLAALTPASDLANGRYACGSAAGVQVALQARGYVVAGMMSGRPPRELYVGPGPDLRTFRVVTKAGRSCVEEFVMRRPS